jgi:hypothetical protein
MALTTTGSERYRRVSSITASTFRLCKTHHLKVSLYAAVESHPNVAKSATLGWGTHWDGADGDIGDTQVSDTQVSAQNRGANLGHPLPIRVCTSAPQFLCR